MFKQDSKYRLHFLIIMVVAHVFLSIINFMEFDQSNKRIEMIGGIVFGGMAIFWAIDLYEFLKNKKSINSNGV